MKQFSVCMLAIVIAFSAAGCAKNVPTFDAKYYPECYDPIEKLCKDQSYQEEAKGAATGALIGALGGAIVGGLSSGDWRGAAIGAAAGGVAGAVTGFFAAQLNKIENQNQRLEEYQRLLGEQSNGWDIERATVERSLQCYTDQAKLVKKQFQDKKISREGAIERLTEIQAGIRYVNTYWADAVSRIDDTIADSEKFLAEEEQKAQQAAATDRAKALQAVKAARKKSQATASAQRQRNQQTTQFVNDGDKLVASLLGEFKDANSMQTLLDVNEPLMCVALR